MPRVRIDRLVRMVEEELSRGTPPPPAGTEAPDEEAGVEWEMLERLRALWEVHDPKRRGARRSHRRLLGIPVRATKGLFRFFFQPFISEILDRQTTFDENAVALLEKMRAARLARWNRLDRRLGTIEERADRLEARGGEAERRWAGEKDALAGRITEIARRFAELEKALARFREDGTRLAANLGEQRKALVSFEEALDKEIHFQSEIERGYMRLVEEFRALAARGGEGDDLAGEAGALAETAGGEIDYAAFHAAASPPEVTRDLYAAYVKYFEGCTRVVDLGCGRGIFLDLLARRGIPAYGVDRDRRLVSLCREAGFDVREGDLVDHLARIEAGSIDGIFLGHIVEHLDLATLLRLFRLSLGRLRPGGVLLFESPNVENLLVLGSSYFRDPTHRLPRHPDTYRFLAETCGFLGVELLYGHPTPEAYKLGTLPPGAALPEDVVAVLNRNIGKLNEILYGCTNFAVLCRKRGGRS